MNKLPDKLGVIPYVRTGKELAMAPAVTPAPETYSDSTFFQAPILMQGLSPECGGFSPAFSIAYLLGLSTPLSGSFLYGYEKTIDGVPNADGTNIQAIGQAVKDSGSCLIDLFPDDGNTNINPNGTPTSYSVASIAAKQDALTRAGWLPVFLNDLSWSGLQNAIYKYKVVIVEAQVGNEWWTSQYGKVIPIGQDSWEEADILPLVPPKNVVDSHFFTLGGQYDQNNIYFANEWSNTWGHNGFGYFGKNYIPYIQNAIVFYKIPPVIQPIITNVATSTALTQQAKNKIIQTIINDIEQVVTLIESEI